MTHDKPASQISAERYQQMVAKRLSARLGRSELSQAEAVAKHYMSHAVIALELWDAVQMERQCGETEMSRQVINRLLGEIKRNHFADLGILLEWRKEDK